MARILVIDDDPLWIDVHVRALRRAGHDVCAASSAVEALELELDGYDLIVTDFDMPRMSGVAFARELCARLRDSAPPLVLVTAYRETPDAWSGLFDAVHRKPYDRGDLLSDITVLLRARTRRCRSGASLRAVGAADEPGRSSGGQ